MRFTTGKQRQLKDDEKESHPSSGDKLDCTNQGKQTLTTGKKLKKQPKPG